MKREALEKAYSNVVSDELPEWQQNTELLGWLLDRNIFFIKWMIRADF